MSDGTCVRVRAIYCGAYDRMSMTLQLCSRLAVMSMSPVACFRIMCFSCICVLPPPPFPHLSMRCVCAHVAPMSMHISSRQDADAATSTDDARTPLINIQLTILPEGNQARTTMAGAAGTSHGCQQQRRARHVRPCAHVDHHA